MQSFSLFSVISLTFSARCRHTFSEGTISIECAYTTRHLPLSSDKNRSAAFEITSRKSESKTLEKAHRVLSFVMQRKANVVEVSWAGGSSNNWKLLEIRRFVSRSTVIETERCVLSVLVSPRNLSHQKFATLTYLEFQFFAQRHIN